MNLVSVNFGYGRRHSATTEERSAGRQTGALVGMENTLPVGGLVRRCNLKHSGVTTATNQTNDLSSTLMA